MKLMPAKTPGFVKSLFPNFVWNIDTHEKILYLTFDDGPTPGITEWVLETLEAYNAKATFFCIGNNIKKHPELFYRIIAQGHAIGNHTYDHLNGWNTPTKAYIKNIIKTHEQIKSLIGNFKFQNYEAANHAILTKNLYRPPYGKLKTRQIRQIQDMGYEIVMWDVLSFDWDAATSQEKCYNNVILSAKEGSIIVFHDSIKASKNLRFTLQKALEFFSKKGFEYRALH